MAGRRTEVIATSGATIVKKNWTADEDFCRKEAGHLATVKNNATKEFVLERLASKNLGSSLVRAWIGGIDIREEGVWRWTDCTPWEDIFWVPGEPTNWTPNEDCLELGLKHPLQSHNRKWNNQYCNAESLSLCSKRICSSDNLEGKTKRIIWNFSSLGVQ